MPGDARSVEVTRRIAATASELFAILIRPNRHSDFDGSGMVRGSEVSEPLSGVGSIFTTRMHRMGRDYMMINYVVEFENDRRIFWEPAPGDLDTAGGITEKIGVPSGYRWGYVLTPVNEDVTVVTEVFDCGSEKNRWILERDEGSWVNGSTSLLTSMATTLEMLERLVVP